MNDLPITVSLNSAHFKAEKALLHYFGQVEAWLNFQGLSANWYADEAAIRQHHFKIVSDDEFAKLAPALANEFVLLKIRQKGQDDLYKALYKSSQNGFEFIVLLDEEQAELCIKQPFSQVVFHRVLFEFAKRSLLSEQKSN
ncbi:hypothetical protein N7931_04440 [Catenovulum sp. 2E275]|uniref:hypothetical protein n=1 Tax=Catenovulum sp. 2E275 TaxID=2980497 RepID=UPI0021CEC8B2|nr:hypothetical protein [Catenovulum sp. 2E275]MCU4674875.1 hypothetical protein [Catenovulum sp. 2E275]